MKKYYWKILEKFDKIVDDYWENMKCEFKTFGKFYENLKKKRTMEKTSGNFIGNIIKKFLWKYKIS